MRKYQVWRKLLFCALACLTADLWALGMHAAEPGGDDDSIGTAKGNEAAASAISQSDYVLQPYDLIHVVVFQEPELERQVRLSENSVISLPLVGSVILRQKSIAQAQALIRDLYDKDFLVNPQVSVTVLEYAKQTVNVLGSVNSPGAISIPPDHPLNIIDAITRAGGFTRLADRKKVKLTHVSEDGGATTAIINIDNIIQSHSSDQVILHKGDVIFVPERLI